jgi:hypothetical protein
MLGHEKNYLMVLVCSIFLSNKVKNCVPVATHGLDLSVGVNWDRRDTNTTVLFSSEGVKNRRAAPSKDYFFHHYCYLCYYCSYVFYFYYYYKAISKEDNSNLLLRSSPLLNACPLNYNDPLIYKDGGSWQFSSKPLVVIFSEPLVDTVFTRSPSSSYKGPLTPTWAGPFLQQ